ncbi:capon-like protein isoform X2 [Clytia hemisphaerica]|uniref:capon-like protein isoform X2 n=1 Tax=Clytia hemisphaerica TaxID=252671 RepID=UPI0034D5874D
MVLHLANFSYKKHPSSPQKWIHAAKDIKEGHVVYQAKYLGTTEVQKAKGTEVVKEAIKKLKVKWQLKKAEAGNKGSKLPRVEINISIDSLKVIDSRTRQMICGRPLHRVSYCADDHSEKKLFAFIAKDQETKQHSCFVFICDKLAADLTMTLGQAFQMAYRRYCENEKGEIKKNKEMISIGKEIEIMKTENVHLREKLAEHEKSHEEQPKDGGELVTTNGGTNGNPDSSSMFFHGDDGETPPTTPRDINSLANPFSPSMPSPRNNSENLFDASFETSFPPNSSSAKPTATEEDLFDPFSTATTTYVSQGDNGLNSLSSQNNVDLFGTSSAFNTSPTQDKNNYHDFDTFGSSPTTGNFIPKVDPFADTPDWESVASEEVSSVSSAPNNPFSVGSKQLTTSQNLDLFNSMSQQQKSQNSFNADPFASINNDNNLDPFGSTDPFSGSANQSADPFGPTNQNSDPFGSANQNSNIFGSSTNDDPFGKPTTNHHQDLFSTESSLDPFSATTPTAANQQTNSFSSNPFASASDISQTDDIFADYLTKVASKEVGTGARKENPFQSVGDEEDRELNKKLSQMNVEESQPTPKPRPRPSGLCGPGQSIPAPPTKQDVKSTSSPITPTAPPTRSSMKVNATSTPNMIQPPKRAQTLPKGMLPNVKVAQQVSLDAGLSRSRQRSQTSTKRPLRDSIKNASKSLEDLVGLDEHPINQNTFPPNNRNALTPPQTPPEQEFFKEVHSPNVKQQNFQNPMRAYSSFDGL